MSTVYRCRVQRDLREVRRVVDEVTYGVSLLDVVSAEEMNEIYRGALKAAGGSENEDGTVEIKVGEVTVTVDPARRTATVRATADHHVEINHDEEEKIVDWSDSMTGEERQREAEKQVDEQIARTVEKDVEDVKNGLAAKLDAELEAVKAQLRAAANEAHKAALRKKAGRLGRVTAEREEQLPQGDRRLTIEVEIG